MSSDLQSVISTEDLYIQFQEILDLKWDHEMGEVLLSVICRLDTIRLVF